MLAKGRSHKQSVSGLTSAAIKNEKKRFFSMHGVVWSKKLPTNCPRSLDPFHIVSNYIK